jgi:hypothetical protein
MVNDVFKFSVKRIKKKINDFILNNYHELFFSGGAAQSSPDEAGTSEDSPKKEQQIKTNNTVAAEFQTKLLTPADFVTNPKILQKA